MKKSIKFFSLISVALLTLTACMGEATQRIKIDGSATVLPLTQAVVEDFAKEHAGVEISVSASGTGGGFKKFVNNEIDVQNASRQMRQGESDEATSNNVEYYEVRVAKDAIVVAVNKANTWVTDLTEEQLYNIFRADSTIQTWADINPEWPAQEIDFYLPALDSGTFDYFHEKIMHGTTDVRADATASQDLNVLITGVEGDTNALGFFSYAYYQASREKVKVVSVDALMPERETITSNTYPLARDLYIYINKYDYETKAVLRSFIVYYMAHVATLAEEVGFVPLSVTDYAQERGTLNITDSMTV